jgi:hypothetical protein
MRRDAQDPQHAQVVRAGEGEREVGGQHRAQIDDAVEAARVTHRIAHDGEPQQVLGGEEQGKPPLDRIEKPAVARMKRGDRVEQQHRHARQDGAQEQHVIGPARGRVVAAHHVKRALAPSLRMRRGVMEAARGALID